jgi:hypothetical protein
MAHDMTMAIREIGDNVRFIDRRAPCSICGSARPGQPVLRPALLSSP